jgi:hypothetical protein
LLATSRSDVAKMIRQLKDEAAKYGLKMHTGKTKVLTNTAVRKRQSIAIGCDKIQILEPSSAMEKYLGRRLCMDTPHKTEVTNRIAAGWASFSSVKTELCSKRYPLASRARLFDAVVTPSVLYGAASWTLTKSEVCQLRSARRSMLRMMFGGGRKRTPEKELEPWVDYVQRATHKAEQIMSAYGSTNWEERHRQLKFRFAGKAARATDGRWTHHLLQYAPLHGEGRYQGRPYKRWSDDLVSYAGGDWMLEAEDEELWDALEDGFVQLQT